MQSKKKKNWKWAYLAEVFCEVVVKYVGWVESSEGLTGAGESVPKIAFLQEWHVGAT